MMNVVNETTIWGKSISGKVDNIHLYTKYKDTLVLNSPTNVNPVYIPGGDIDCTGGNGGE
jgi:hypothetical protein